MTPSLAGIEQASERIRPVITRTPLQFHKRLSEKYGCNIFLKREDQQPVRSYKLRGAFNMVVSLNNDERSAGVVTASAGNHAQGVAYSCHYLRIPGTIFMPANTPFQKVSRVRSLGGDYIHIHLVGETYDEAFTAAMKFSVDNKCPMIPPFDHHKIIEGQATMGKEILEDCEKVDILFIPVGGGGLAAGLGLFFRSNSPGTTLIGVEPKGAASMTAAFDKGSPFTLEKIDPFIDGAAVKTVGELTYQLCKDGLDHMHTIPEGKVCSALLKLYNEDGILAEPAGVLSIAALDDFADVIKGKNVVCILSGSNNDSNRMEEIKKLADAWEGLQHYMVIRFHHNPDGLKEFFSILGPEDYVNRIEYIRRDHGRSTYALVGLRSKDEDCFQQLITRLDERNVEFREVKKEDFLFKYWV